MKGLRQFLFSQNPNILHINDVLVTLISVLLTKVAGCVCVWSGPCMTWGLNIDLEIHV